MTRARAPGTPPQGLGASLRRISGPSPPSKGLWSALRAIPRPSPPSPSPGPAARGRSMVVVDIARIIREPRAGGGLEGAGDADDHVVDAAGDALGALGGAEREARGAAFEVAGAVVGEVGNLLLTDVCEHPAVAFVRAAGDVEGAQAKLVGLVDALHRAHLLGDAEELD